MRVFVYYNLHKKLWSVKALEGPDKGKVIDRREFVFLRDVTPRVSESGRQRVLREQRKNVHAGLVGTLSEHAPSYSMTNKCRISYNPYKGSDFYKLVDGTTYKGSQYATLLAFDKPEVYVI